MAKEITISYDVFANLISARAAINDLRVLVDNYARELSAAGVLGELNAILQRNIYGGDGDAFNL